MKNQYYRNCSTRVSSDFKSCISKSQQFLEWMRHPCFEFWKFVFFSCGFSTTFPHSWSDIGLKDAVVVHGQWTSPTFKEGSVTWNYNDSSWKLSFPLGLWWQGERETLRCFFVRWMPRFFQEKHKTTCCNVRTIGR